MILIAGPCVIECGGKAETMKRNVGTTTNQIKSLPKDAVFVWVDNDTSYPKSLAKSLGRDDLEIVGVSFLDSNKFRGRNYTGIDIDHAVEMSPERIDAFHIIISRINR